MHHTERRAAARRWLMSVSSPHSAKKSVLSQYLYVISWMRLISAEIIRNPKPKSWINQKEQERRQMSDESIFDPCPYCQKDGCEHLLLVVDETFRTAEGGLLMDSFNSRWTTLFDDDDEDIDEKNRFNQLIEEDDALASATAVANQDSLPGLSSSYQIFYAESKEKANVALFLFGKRLSPLKDDSPPTPLAQAIGGTDDLGVLRKIDEQLLYDADIHKLEQTPQHPLTGQLKMLVDELIAELPKPTSYLSGMARGMKTLKLRGNVKRFFIVQKRFPSQKELKKLWDLH